jgi:uncharacterized protein YjbI with pentapeptide repeats
MGYTSDILSKDSTQWTLTNASIDATSKYLSITNGTASSLLIPTVTDFSGFQILVELAGSIDRYNPTTFITCTVTGTVREGTEDINKVNTFIMPITHGIILLDSTKFLYEFTHSLNAVTQINISFKTSSTIVFRRYELSLAASVTEALQNIEQTTVTKTFLEATYITSDEIAAKYLEATKAALTYVTAEQADLTYATIENLNVATASINDLKVNHMDVVEADVNTITADIGEIQTLVNGNLTSSNIKSLNLTAANTVIANALIKDAMIDTVNASKVNTGTLDTAKVTVQSTSGNLQIKDNTIQISDGTKPRVQIGKDASADYNIYIWDVNGNLMFDATGLKADAIKGIA